MKSRIVILFSAFAVMWSFLTLRAARLQFLPHEQLEERYDRLFQTTIKLEPRRGTIYDRKGRELAVSIPAHSLFADPATVTEPRRLVRSLAPLLKMKPSELQAKIRDRKRRFVWISRKLDGETRRRIQALNLKGISFVEETRRVYPNEKMLAPVLGFVGQEGQGLEGLELSLDSVLSGQAKKVTYRRDARGRPLTVDGKMFFQSPEGNEVVLTIDSEIQHELEKELETVTTEFDADQAFGVILDPQNGEVVAMGMAPGFDANKALKMPSEKRRNRTVTDTFEPGSVVKALAVAAALEEGLIQPNTRIDTENGRMKVGDRWIRESDEKHKWKSLTVSEVLAFSSNIGTTKIALQLGDQRLRKYFELFGFGSKSGLEVSGEARGALLPLPWRDHLLSNVSFGQGMAATPLQVAAAYAAIANGGIWREPTLVKGQRNPGDENLSPISRKKRVERSVIRHETSQAMRLLLAGVTAEGGTGLNARVEGFPVAGKTGTAQKVNPVGRGYMSGAYVSSFAGFLPVNDPKYVIYIVVDHPKNRSYYGSQVAAPVFSRMATFISRLEGWAPILLAEKNLVRREPSVAGEEAAALRSRTPNPLVGYRAERAFSDSGRARFSLESSETVPDLQNLTVREVMAALHGQEVDLRIQGSGVVHQSWPRPGEAWQNKKKLVLQLKPFLRTEKSVPPDYYRDSEASSVSPRQTF